MPVVPVLRHVLRGKIRAQVRYQITLGERLVAAYRLNPDLLIFTGATGDGSTVAFNQCLNQMALALLTRA